MIPPDSCICGSPPVAGKTKPHGAGCAGSRDERRRSKVPSSSFRLWAFRPLTLFLFTSMLNVPPPPPFPRRLAGFLAEGFREMTETLIADIKRGFRDIHF